MRTRPLNNLAAGGAIACLLFNADGYASRLLPFNGFRYIRLIDNWLNPGVNESQLFNLQLRRLYWYNTSILRKMISRMHDQE